MRATLRALAWAAGIVSFAALAALAAVVSGGHELRDRQGNVVLGWDAGERRLRLLERPALALDGPHAYPQDDGFTVFATRRSGTAWRLRASTLPRERAVVAVEVDNAARSRFDVPLRVAGPPADAVFAAAPSRLLLLSDIEGEFDALVRLLQAQGVVDGHLHWTYGDGHLALVGDLVDRGEHMLPVLWLVYRLEAQAHLAGGAVHVVLGNHEQLAMAGGMEEWPRRLVATAAALAREGRAQPFSEATVLGAWLRTRPVIAKVGDTLLVHGGVSRVFLEEGLGIEAANALARRHFGTPNTWLPFPARPVLGRWGLTRYRGMALPDDPRRALEDDAEAHLRAVLARHGAARIAIGHTPVPRVALERRGRVLRLAVRHAAQVPEAALIEGGRVWRVDARGGREPL